MLCPPRLALVLVAALAAPVLAAACGTDAIGIGACREVESARCVRAPSCGIDLSRPVHPDGTAGDVDACIRYYHEQCLHGLAAPDEPGAVAVKACVDAINAGDCAIVKQPETAPSCAWLIPPAPPAVVDAATTDASDAASE
jgi:hypothetical protein